VLILQFRPWDLYRNVWNAGGLYGNYSNYDNYWINISAYMGGKNSGSTGVTPTIAQYNFVDESTLPEQTIKPGVSEETLDIDGKSCIYRVEVLSNGIIHTTLMDQNRNVLDSGSYDSNNETVIYDEGIEEIDSYSTNPWTPVYMATYSKKLKDIVGDVSKFGVYSVAILAGLGLVVSSMGISAPVIVVSLKEFLASYIVK